LPTGPPVKRKKSAGRSTPGPNGTWTETVLHRFGESARDGTAPNYGALVLDAAGNLYGTTLGGGSSNYGVVFEVKP